MAWRRLPIFSWAAAIGSWLMLVIGPVFLAAVTMLLIDRNFDGVFFAGDAGGSPLLWQHLSWIFYTGSYMLILITALAAIAEIIPAFAGKPLFNRGATIGSLVAIAVIGTLAWTQNMLTAPIGIGWMYFAMVMSLALIVPFGLIFFNLIATLVGGATRMHAPLLFAVGALSSISIGLGAEICHSLIASAWRVQHTVDSTAATHFALIGGAVFGGFAALHWWFPKLTGRAMGENMAQISFWTIAVGTLVTFIPLFLAGGLEGQVVDAYKFFGSTGVDAYNLIATIGVLHPRDRDPADADQRDPQPQRRHRGRSRPVGRRVARVVRALASGGAQLRRPARRPQRAGRCATSGTRSRIARAARRSRLASRSRCSLPA